MRVAIRNDYEIVVLGLAEILRPFSEQVEIVELDASVQGDYNVDITLYDTFSQSHVDGTDIDEVIADPGAGKVVIYTWNTDPALVATARRKGVHGYIAKTVDGDSLADALVAIHRGRTLFVGRDDEAVAETRIEFGNWPGRVAGLTAREAEVISLITQGLRNQDIADKTYLSINSVKSYIRSAYRKMDVTSRSQAVLWGVEHGMLPDTTRIKVPGGF